MPYLTLKFIINKVAGSWVHKKTFAQSENGATVLGQRTEQPSPVPDAGGPTILEGREANSAAGQVGHRRPAALQTCLHQGR